jgi:hypothetical protein
MGKISIEEAEINNVIYKGDDMTTTTKEERTMEEIVGILETGYKYGLGLDILSAICGIPKTTLWRISKQNNLISKRVFDIEHLVDKLIYNEDTPYGDITHAIDFYRLSNGSIARMHHARKNLPFEDKQIIMLGMIVNVKTGKKYWKVWNDNKETSIRAIDIIQMAIDEGEDIKVLCSDRVLGKVIKGCELLGIKVVVYGKSITRPYNTPIESQFGNISKCFYTILDIFDNCSIESATQLFKSILEVYYNKNIKELMQFDSEHPYIAELTNTIQTEIRKSENSEE